MDDELLPNLLDDVPAALGELIGAVGRGVADAQQALDRSTIDQISRIYGDLDDEAQAYLRAIGYQPTWYKIPELKALVHQRVPSFALACLVLAVWPTGDESDPE